MPAFFRSAPLRLPAGRLAAATAASLAAALGLAACGGGDGGPPQLAAATPAKLAACSSLASLALPGTRITSVAAVAASDGSNGQPALPAHCLVQGQLNERISPVDGNRYAIGFEMRLPNDWNGRFFHQGNGGLDGSVVPATGVIGGGGPSTTALAMGFAVLSSDAGHPQPTPFFGADPQARLDYGYQAVGKLTPIARSLIQAAYGKAPDRSYFAGCSNGGRHAMVTAARYAQDYDGVLAGNPGFHLPKAASTQLWKVKQYATIAGNGANGQLDISTAVTPAEYSTVGASITAKCDALDGVKDGIVSDVVACQAAFNIQTDVPTCEGGTRTGSCLTPAQKNTLQRIFAGPRLADGTPSYSHTWFDPGVAGKDFALWHYFIAQNLDPGSVSLVFNTPPMPVPTFLATPPGQIALNYDLDRDYGKLFATNGTYTESGWSFMTPPDETNLSTLRNRGGKLMVYHGTADGVFSAADTANWYDRLQQAELGHAAGYARLYLVPGMNHCANGPSTDQFDMVTALVNWVEKGQAPDRVIAKARGAGSTVPNPEVPASWSPGRTRPLCPYPLVARYNGSGDVESADSFSCKS